MPTPMVPIALGLRAQPGGGVVVGVAIENGQPRVVLSTVLATAAEGDRLTIEPYRVAAEMGQASRGSEAAAAVAEGCRRQGELASQGLSDIVDKLHKQGFEPVVAALLVNRAGWITDLLAYSQAWAEHVPIAERLAVRDALRFAVDHAGIALVESDEKSLAAIASRELRIAPADVDANLKSLGAASGKPWRKEQKLACLAAWLASRAACSGEQDDIRR